jgi:hypothetical protein
MDSHIIEGMQANTIAFFDAGLLQPRRKSADDTFGLLSRDCTGRI